jgi:hypothetical protein
VDIPSDFATHPWVRGFDGVLDLWCDGSDRSGLDRPGAIDRTRRAGHSERRWMATDSSRLKEPQIACCVSAALYLHYRTVIITNRILYVTNNVA